MSSCLSWRFLTRARFLRWSLSSSGLAWIISKCSLRVDDTPTLCVLPEVTQAPTWAHCGFSDCKGQMISCPTPTGLSMTVTFPGPFNYWRLSWLGLSSCISWLDVTEFYICMKATRALLWGKSPPGCKESDANEHAHIHYQERWPLEKWYCFSVFLLTLQSLALCVSLRDKFWAPSVSKDFPSLEEAAHLLFLHLLFSFFKKLCIGVYPVNNVVIVSGEEWRDSAR